MQKTVDRGRDAAGWVADSLFIQLQGAHPEVAARALGVSRTAVHNWMTDAVSPQTDRLPPIVAALDITQAEFFGPLPATPEPPPVVEDVPDCARVMTIEEHEEATFAQMDACPACGHKNEAA